MTSRVAEFQRDLGGGSVKCELCPHSCIIADGRTGLCGTRKNVAGVLYALNFGEVTSLALDPIEKKPLYHFFPGASIVSVGTWGCNFRCGFCQNWEISQQRPLYVKEMAPDELVEMALQFLSHGNIGISYTYSEPIVWYEFVLATAELAKENGLKNVLVTNGYINPDPLERLLPLVDAMNVDLKAFNNDFYVRVCGGRYEHVLRTIETAVSYGVHVEVTTLLVPDGNDDLPELEAEFKALASISKDIPLHLSRYHPAYKYGKPPTDLKTMIAAYNLASKYLNYVYLGNVWDERYETTYCPKCGNPLISRRGYSVKIVDLAEGGRCGKCSNPIPVKL